MDYKIGHSFKAGVLFETHISIDGAVYLVIYGKHINGNYCCIPNHNIGCEMDEPNAVNYNAGKLMGCGMDKMAATALARAIKEKVGGGN